MTVFITMLLGLSCASSQNRVSLSLPGKTFLVSKPFTVTVKNETSKSVAFCSDFGAKTAEGIATSPDFELIRKRGQQWISQVGDDVGHILAPDSLAASESKSYKVQLSHPGTYRFILHYRVGESADLNCAKQSLLKARARSIVFTVSTVAGGAR